MIFDYKRRAKKNSYKCFNGRPVKRSRNSIIALCIHYTSGTKDTAKNECDYFATGNTRSAGAHSFVDLKGLTGRSIPWNYIAWSVGDRSNGKGKYFNIVNNSNSISIELCGIADKKGVTAAQKKALKKLVRYYGKKCPNIKYIIRHYDVTTKICPAPYCNSAKNDAKWKELRAELMFELKKVHSK